MHSCCDGCHFEGMPQTPEKRSLITLGGFLPPETFVGHFKGVFWI